MTQRERDMKAARTCDRFVELLEEKFARWNVTIPDHERKTIELVTKRSFDLRTGKVHVDDLQKSVE